VNPAALQVTTAELREVFRLRHEAGRASMGWGPRLRSRFGYFTPDEYYEAVVARLVTPGCAWLDVGCGRNIFPSNHALARMLARRCGVLVGVDPDETLEENDLVHERARQRIEDFKTERTFDVVTLRMVAEHVTDPAGTLSALARLTKCGGKVVIYTINQWSPVPMITWLVPFRLHHLPKRLLWQTDPKDTFPVAYHLNTRRVLRRIFEQHRFREAAFGHLDDCRTFSRFRSLLTLELCLWRGLRAIGLRYPENCLLGIYERI
jgi:2-polyprenyl-3-methyl-5-hydroxy-6-metoxy-1,4-benzoquinol methylase